MRIPARLVLPFLVLLSLLLTLTRPFYGTGIGLALAILLQIGLPGYLLARVLPVDVTHPIVRMVWVLACGLGLTIVLGGLLRYLSSPVPVYLLALHAVLLGLALFRAGWQRTAWRFERNKLPLYALVAAACAALLVAGFERSRIHFEMEVPTVYAAEVEWLAAGADYFATADRWIGFSADMQAGNRTGFDGWTYNEAAWVWASGIPTADLLWHGVTPLFIWTVPLITFATAYVLSRRESVSAWSAAAVTIFALTTIDPLIFSGNENTLYYGAQAVYLDTVRGASTILVVPLAIFALLSYLAKPTWRGLLPLLLLGHALALMRVRQIFILEVVGWATLAVWWLAAPTPRRTGAALLLGIVLASFALLPFQMYIQPTLKGSVYLSHKTNAMLDTQSIIATANGSDRVYVLEGLYFRVLRGLPLIGDTFIIDPLSWFYTPLIGTAMLIGLAAGWRWRRGLAAQHLFGTTAAISLFVFLPGVTPVYTRIFGSVASVNLIAGLNFALPVGLALGFALDWLLERQRRLRYLNGGAALAAGALLLFLVFEPVSLIQASPRDQIEAMNSAQGRVAIAPFDRQLLADFPKAVDPAVTTRILTRERTGGFLVESFPNVFVPGWESPPDIITASHHFLDGDTPFVDDADIRFMRDQAFTHVIVDADSSATPQLLLQPERYRLLLDTSGFLIFQVVAAPQMDGSDRLFRRMNDLLAKVDLPRWQDGAFALARSADPAPWQPIAAAWSDQLARQPSDTARYGLALTDLLMNRDDEALPLWEALYRTRPDVPLFAAALAYTRHQRGGDPLPSLLTNLDAPQSYVRVMAARALLDQTFFYLLTPQQIDQALAVTQNDALAWSKLADWQRPGEARARAALLMSAKRFDSAEQELASILPIEIRPGDLVARAAIRLLRGDVDGAQALLQPATDADWVKIRHYLHPDRWEPPANSAARAFAQLQSADPTSLLALTEPDAGLVMRPVIEQQDNALTITATFGAFVPADEPRVWRALVVSPDASIQYGKTEVPAETSESALTRATLTVDLPPDLPPLTPARVIVQSLYSDALVYDTRLIDTVLNRPGAAAMPADAAQIGLRFGDHIALEGYTAALDDGALNLTLYWQTDAALPDDDQVFVHVVGADGTLAAQGDSAPVGNRYPTGDWRVDTLIEDRHHLPLDLPPGQYRVYVGLYKLADQTRLPVTPQTAIVESDGVRVYSFSLP